MYFETNIKVHIDTNTNTELKCREKNCVAGKTTLMMGLQMTFSFRPLLHLEEKSYNKELFLSERFWIIHIRFASQEKYKPKFLKKYK